jgi:multiple sugar transport system ATP-binding protein
MAAIVLDGLTKVFDGGTVAVDDLSLDIAAGEFLVLLGPTGCGKSTVLRLVAGLDEPTGGRILFDGRPVDRLHTRDRNVAMVFQDYGLYPHLSVADNIAFPLRVTQVSETEQTARVREVADVLGIGDLLHRLPGQLSGGQRQRVAMARAVIRRPAVFLLDEPMSNLDCHLRAGLRTEIVTLTRQFGVTTLYVTHDRTEALTMGDRVAVLRRGRLQQVGAPTEVYNDPANLYVAAFLGPGRTTLLQSVVYAGPDGAVMVDLGSQVLRVPAPALAAHHSARLVLGIRSDTLSIVDSGPDALTGTVRLVEDFGHEAVVHVDIGAVAVARATTRLELPEPEGGLGQRRRPAAQTEYGFYPRFDAAGAPVDSRGDLLVRIARPAPVPRTGDTVAVAVDPDRLYFFDNAGTRLRG